MTVRIHASRLLALKAAKEHRRGIPVSEVVEKLNQTAVTRDMDTRISRGAVDAWLSGELTRLEAHIIEAWCEYLPCTVGQLLEVEGSIPFEEGEPGQFEPESTAEAPTQAGAAVSEHAAPFVTVYSQ